MDFVSEMMYLLQGTIITHGRGPVEPNGPKWLYQAVTEERLIESMIKRKSNESPTATDAEVVIYLSAASLEFPFNHDWTEIYLQTAAKVIARHRPQHRDDVYEKIGMEKKELDEWQKAKKKELSDWLYKKSKEATMNKLGLKGKYRTKREADEKIPNIPKGKGENKVQLKLDLF